MGVRKTNCRGRLARSGTIAGSFWHLANVLTIRVLQIWERRTRINISPAKKTDLPFRITSSYSPKVILRLRKRKLQLLPSVLMKRQNEEAKAGAFAYGANIRGGNRCWLRIDCQPSRNLHRMDAD